MRLTAALSAFALLFTGTAHAEPVSYFQDGFENEPANRWNGFADLEAAYWYENNNTSYQGSWNVYLTANNGGMAGTNILVDVSTWTRRNSCKASVVVNPLGHADTIVAIDVIDADRGGTLANWTDVFSGNTHQYLGTKFFAMRATQRKVRLQVVLFSRTGQQLWKYARADWMRLECPN